jgi:hypothetical protein
VESLSFVILEGEAMRRDMKWLAAGLAVAANLGFVGVAGACTGLLTLPTASPTNSVTFGDGISYSLPILGLDVQSSPGQIDDCIVIATGSSGTPINTNFAGMDNAYATPNGTGGSPYFRTGDPVSSPDPGQVAPFAGDQTNTWDTTLTALKTFLGNTDLVVYFNHNQTNSGDAIDQDLFIWAQIALVDNECTAATATLEHPCAQYFYITSVPNTTGLENFGQPGGNPFAYTGPQVADTACLYPSASDACAFPFGGIGTGAASGLPMYMVRAIGQVCLNGPVGVGTPIPCDGSQGPVVATVNENLGADQVANAVVFPELNAILDAANFAGYDVLHADIRMGCNAQFVTGGVCPAGSVLNNGFEQIFIGRLAPEPGPPGVPEPSTLMLLGLGLLGLAVVRIRSKA